MDFKAIGARDPLTVKHFVYQLISCFYKVLILFMLDFFDPKTYLYLHLDNQSIFFRYIGTTIKMYFYKEILIFGTKFKN